MYPEYFTAPMREELTRYGVEETRTPESVDALLKPGSGSVMVVINSVCGCAAGKARPGIVQSLQHSIKPDRVATVFAGGDVAATARVRELLSGFPPSSPSVAIFNDGKPVYYMPRFEIESSDALTISEKLKRAYEQHCAATAA
ncbi:MAG: BrxA/BrxB family bacilliredoxin [Acidobacteria bacterium]|nr:BrxA/BrxB family bacilliredoxin [Acidobacteriota bacterium]